MKPTAILEAPAPRKGGVVLLHGFASIPGTMWPLAHRLSRNGYATLIPFYPSWRRELDQVVAQLQVQVTTFTEGQKGKPVHFVGHSMGGLIARALIEQARPANLGKLVMLGTPNGGSEIADRLNRNRFLSRALLGSAAPALVTHRDTARIKSLGKIDYPAGVIAGNRALIDGPISRCLPSPHDGKVSVAATHVAGESDHLVLPITHFALPYHPMVQRQVIYFLETGQFRGNLAGQP